MIHQLSFIPCLQYLNRLDTAERTANAMNASKKTHSLLKKIFEKILSLSQNLVYNRAKNATAWRNGS